MAIHSTPIDPYFRDAGICLSSFDLTLSQQTALKDCINGHCSVPDAVQTLTSYVNSAPTLFDMHQRLTIWHLLSDTAIHIPGSQSIIIAILQYIRTLPWVQVPLDADGHHMRQHWDFDEGNGWKELCEWSSTWWQSFNGSSADYWILRYNHGGQLAMNDDVRERWVHACAFAARMDATGDEYISLFGCALDRAVNAIVDALEFEYEDGVVPYSLEAAALLFVHAAEGLRRRSIEGKEELNLEGRWGGNEKRLWEPGRKYSLARWEFWRGRWAFWAEKLDDREDGMGEVAMMALIGMTSIPCERLAGHGRVADEQERSAS